MNTYRYMSQIEKDAMAYSRAKPFLDELKAVRDILTVQQMRTLKGQALAGDITGASRGLAKLLNELRQGGLGY